MCEYTLEEILFDLKKIKLYDSSGDEFFDDLNKIIKLRFENLKINTYIYKIPTEIIINILEFLEYKDLIVLISVNKLFNNIINNYFKDMILVLILYTVEDKVNVNSTIDTFDVFILKKLNRDIFDAEIEINKKGKYKFTNFLDSRLLRSSYKDIFIVINNPKIRNINFMINTEPEKYINKNINVLLKYYNKYIINYYYDNNRIKNIYLYKNNNYKYINKYKDKILIL